MLKLDGGAILVGKLTVNVNLPPEVAQFAERLFGPVLELADWGTDHIRFVRWKSGIKVLTRAQEIARDAGIEPKQVPVKFLVPFMEKCSLEDHDSELVDMWARLLVSAAEKFETKHALFVDILSQIGPQEAQILRDVWEEARDRGYQGFKTLLDTYDQGLYWNSPRGKGGQLIMFATDSDGRYSDGDLPDSIYSLLILERQNLIKIQTAWMGEGDERKFRVNAILTPLGFDFVQCCEA